MTYGNWNIPHYVMRVCTANPCIASSYIQYALAAPLLLVTCLIKHAVVKILCLTGLFLEGNKITLYVALMYDINLGCGQRVKL